MRLVIEAVRVTVQLTGENGETIYRYHAENLEQELDVGALINDLQAMKPKIVELLKEPE